MKLMKLKKRRLGEIIAALAVGEFDPAKEYDAEIKLHREARSITANSYYWVLIGKFADWARVSKNRLHNEMLARYGQALMIDDLCAYTVIVDNDKYMELSDLHLKPTSEVKRGRDGKDWRTFIILRGSHTYDSREMSILIDGLINEITGSGAPIQTMTPAELATLKGYGYDVSEKAEKTA